MLAVLTSEEIMRVLGTAPCFLRPVLVLVATLYVPSRHQLQTPAEADGRIG